MLSLFAHIPALQIRAATCNQSYRVAACMGVNTKKCFLHIIYVSFRWNDGNYAIILHMLRCDATVLIINHFFILRCDATMKSCTVFIAHINDWTTLHFNATTHVALRCNAFDCWSFFPQTYCVAMQRLKSCMVFIAHINGWTTLHSTTTIHVMLRCKGYY